MNPKSSNPLLIYQDLYQPWRDRDDYDKFMHEWRANLTAGVLKKQHEGIIDEATAKRLERICEEVDIVFMYPIIYRVDTQSLDTMRLQSAGSALSGSSECLITDLHDAELDDMLFLDFNGDEDFRRVVYDEYFSYRQTRVYTVEPDEVLAILERRCRRGAIQDPIQSTDP